MKFFLCVEACLRQAAEGFLQGLRHCTLFFQEIRLRKGECRHRRNRENEYMVSSGNDETEKNQIVGI